MGAGVVGLSGPMVPILALALAGHPWPVSGEEGAAIWRLGTPIVTYWCGPSMTDAVATQMAEGGFNVVWCGEEDLDLVHRHGLRAQLANPLISPASLESPAERQKLDDLIARVRRHPALYAYYLTDEPSASQFHALGRLVAYLRERDPAHVAYINLFPTYATNEQLGNEGDTVASYTGHLAQYIDKVRPALISYDHYQFAVAGDNPQYFLNLAMIRRTAVQADLPFLNIVQACTWTPSMRVPTPDEMRYLVYTTLAYGAQGISYYVYSCAGHTGAIAHADGTPTPLYHALKTLNRDFVALATRLQELRSLGVYHVGMLPPGAEALPEKAAFTLEPPVAAMDYRPPEPVRGLLMGFFGSPKEGSDAVVPTHLLIVNLDYKADTDCGVKGPAPLEAFDAETAQWSRLGALRAELRLPKGGGKLLRVER